MNKIVREHYPVEKLPEDLRRLVPEAAEVTVEITVAEPEKRVGTGLPSGTETAAAIRKLRAQHPNQKRTMADIVSDVRALRDEWDD